MYTSTYVLEDHTAVAAAALLVPFLWWTVSPLFIDEIVDEPLSEEETVTTASLAQGTFVSATDPTSTSSSRVPRHHAHTMILVST